MKRSLLALSLTSLVCAGVVRAEVKKGDVILDFLGGWTQQNIEFADGSVEGDFTEYFAALRPGIALTDNVRVALVAAFAHVDVMGLKREPWAVGVSGEYVFAPANQWNLYVGGEAAWARADVDLPLIQIGDAVGAAHIKESGWLFAPRAGILLTMNRTNNLFAEYQYQIWAGDLDDFLENGHLVLVGIEHKFRVGR